MAAPPVFRSIDKQDVPELKNADKLLQPLSQHMEATTKALDAGLTTRNLACYVRSVEVVSQDTEPADPDDPPTFDARSPPAWPRPLQMVLGEKGKPFPGKVQEVRILSATRADGALSGPLSVEGWQAGPANEDGRIVLTLPRVNGLAPNVRYTLNLLIVAV